MGPQRPGLVGVQGSSLCYALPRGEEGVEKRAFLCLYGECGDAGGSWSRSKDGFKGKKPADGGKTADFGYGSPVPHEMWPEGGMVERTTSGAG